MNETILLFFIIKIEVKGQVLFSLKQKFLSIDDDYFSFLVFD